MYCISTVSNNFMSLFFPLPSVCLSAHIPVPYCLSSTFRSTLKKILFYTLKENILVFLYLIFPGVTLQFHGFPKNDRIPFFMVEQ